ncbi:MAG: DpnD/PcfM family protein [Rikenellaceae bacterium]
MKIYEVEIVETLIKTVEVEANSREEAETIACDNYNAELDGYILDSGDHVDTDFYADRGPFNRKRKCGECNHSAPKNICNGDCHCDAKDIEVSEDDDSEFYAEVDGSPCEKYTPRDTAGV